MSKSLKELLDEAHELEEQLVEEVGAISKDNPLTDAKYDEIEELRRKAAEAREAFRRALGAFFLTHMRP